ncbi:ABC transporter permease [Dietzia sp. WMMA184]|uniref:ABC transporter permease n=1 Tax=Dietzia sp. WMMA184 TaxID=2039808 RepID=UPI000BDF4E91|nr:ABC transporter permease [Dietzia sp. WMMA184]
MSTTGASDGSKQGVHNRHLKAIGRRPPLGVYLRRIHDLRHFLVAQARYRSMSTGRGTYLGRIWLLLEPFLRVLMYFIVFGLILKISRGMDNFVAFLAIGIIMFEPLASSLSGGSAVLQKNRAIVKSFAFPRGSLILSDSLRGLYDSIPDVLAMLVFIMVIPPHVQPTWTWVLLVPLLICARMLVTGLLFCTAWLSSLLPDVKHLWAIISRFWFYGSGVVFPLDRFINDPAVMIVVQANPAYVVLEMAREILMEGTVPHAGMWSQLFGWGLAFLSFGLLLFWSREEKYSRER